MLAARIPSRCLKGQIASRTPRFQRTCGRSGPVTRRDATVCLPYPLVMDNAQRKLDRVLSPADGVPAYTTRESRRARHVHLKVSSQGLEVVVPQGFAPHRIPGIVRAHRCWIDRAMRRMEALGRSNGSQTRPELLDLEAIGERWSVLYQQRNRSGIRLRERRENGALIVSGEIQDTAACHAALRQWLLRKGRHQLVPWLSRLAEERGVTFGRVTIRCQKTRWGSCTRRPATQDGDLLPDTISLNAKLLFLPSHLVRYVLLHELCHTAEPNHSPAFWALLRRYEPQTDALRKELRRAWTLVPGWLARRSP